jgi:protein-tyrosine phosphatase
MARHDPSAPQLVFVCTGNTCRSPMAEALLRARLGCGLPWRVLSAGIAATEGCPASPESVAALRERGLDLSAHRSRPLTRALVESADLLVPLSLLHYAAIVDRFPEAREKTLLLGSFLGDGHGPPQDIPDPIGGDAALYRTIRDRIAEAVANLAEFLSSWS